MKKLYIMISMVIINLEENIILAPQIANTPTQVSQTTKTFEKASIWRNIHILSLPRVTF
jgi:hypothetical protein